MKRKLLAYPLLLLFLLGCQPKTTVRYIQSLPQQVEEPVKIEPTPYVQEIPKTYEAQKISNAPEPTPSIRISSSTSEEKPQEIQQQPIEEKIALGKLKIHYIDVGQGDGILIQTPQGKNVLIDCGRWSSVADYIRLQGISSIDVLITTHPDADHIGGCDDVMAAMPIGAVYDNGGNTTTNAYAEYIALAKHKQYSVVKTDMALTLDSLLDIQLIIPYDTGGLSEDNDDSILVKIVYKNSSFLFTGDCEQSCEAEVLPTADLDVDVLKVAHHGSKTSTTQQFLDEVTPKYAILSVGTNNYGHPSPEVIDRLTNAESEVHRTDLERTITITTDGDNYVVE